MKPFPFGDLTIELIIGFFALLFSTKILKNRQLNQLTPFDFISALVLGELLGNAIYDKEISIYFVLYAIALWTLLMYTMEIVTQKYKRSRKFLEGDPSIIIRHGQLDYQEIKKNMLDINELQGLLREKDVFSLRQVEYAILERNGTLSVLKKFEYEMPTNADLKVKEKPVSLPTTFIIDGEIIWDNLKAAGFDDQWLHKQLDKQNIHKLKDVFYAEWTKDEGLHISFK